MNTRKYQKTERKAAKRISRSPVYQALRQRALKAEQTAADTRSDLKQAEANIRSLQAANGNLRMERDAALSDLALRTPAA